MYALTNAISNIHYYFPAFTYFEIARDKVASYFQSHSPIANGNAEQERGRERSENRLKRHPELQALKTISANFDITVIETVALNTLFPNSFVEKRILNVYGTSDGWIQIFGTINGETVNKIFHKSQLHYAVYKDLVKGTGYDQSSRPLEADYCHA
ncbi:MAG: hypothetical protein ACOYK9_05535 [Chlamydiia bacterium]